MPTRKEKFIAEVRKASKKELDTESISMFEAIFDGFENSEETAEVRKANIAAIVTEKIGSLDLKEGETMADSIRSIVNKIDEIEQRSTATLSNKDKYAIRKKVKEVVENEGLRKLIKENNSITIEFNHKRSAAMMTTANIMSGSVAPQSENFMVDEEVSMLRYPQNFIIDIISSMQLAVVPETIVETEQDTKEGAATLTAEGSTKPLVSFTFKKEIFTRKKYAAHFEITEELEIDYSRLYAKIVSLFEDEVIRAWQNGVLADVIALAAGYVSTVMDGEMVNPDEATAVLAICLQIRDNEFEPDVIWMNPGDVTLLKAQKNSEGDYVINPFMLQAGQFDGLTLRTSNKIDSRKVLIGQSSTIKEKHTGFIMRMGLINDQFIKNEKSVVGEVFSILYQATNHEASWVYADLDAVIDVLNKENV